MDIGCIAQRGSVIAEPFFRLQTNFFVFKTENSLRFLFESFKNVLNIWVVITIIIFKILKS